MTIKFGEQKPATIFSEIAQNAAEQIKQNTRKNTTTQIRKFYDELALWNDRVNGKEAIYKELEPFIKMLKAKVAYAKARDHIDDNFLNIFNQVIDEIHCAKTLRDGKLFMEAVIGFCKYLEEQTKRH